jgi:hypothetical protein
MISDCDQSRRSEMSRPHTQVSLPKICPRAMPSNTKSALRHISADSIWTGNPEDINAIIARRATHTVSNDNSVGSVGANGPPPSHRGNHQANNFGPGV